jgi:hypothetical protein
MMPARKIDQLRAYMAAENWERALALAAKFPRLGAEKAVIVRAHECYAHPNFYRSLHTDLDAAKAAGIAALQRRYP